MQVKNSVKYMLPMLIIIVGLVVTHIVSNSLEHLRQARIRHEFAASADSRFFAVERELNRTLEVLTFVEALFNSSVHVSRQSFHVFAQTILSTEQTLQALEWIPRVGPQEKTIYEAEASRDGYPNFVIFEHNDDGNLVPVQKRSEYFPVYYVEPLFGNNSTFGFDLGSNSRRRHALIQARDTGRQVATAPIQLVEHDQSKVGVLIFLPVYKNRTTPRQPSLRKEQLKGFVLSVIRVGDLIDLASQGHRHGIELKVVDVTQPDQPESLYEVTSFLQNSANLLQVQTELQFAGRRWQITAVPSPGAFSFSMRWTHYLPLLVGYLLTILISTYLLLLVKRNEDIESNVRERTRELIESEERYQLAIDGTNDGIWDWDIKQNYVHYSGRFRELVGYQANDVENFPNEFSSWKNILHPDDKALNEARVQKHLDENIPFDVEYRLKMRNGSYRYFRAKGKAICDEEGKPYRMAGAIIDIHDEKLNHLTIKQQQDELQLIFDNVPVKIWYKDDHNKILRLNKQAADSMRVTVEEAEGANTYDLFPAMAKKYHLDDLEVINSGKAKFGIIEKYTPKNGTEAWVRTDKVPYYDPDTGQRRVLVVALDITERRRSEEELQKYAAELERSNEELERFAYIASHDLQEPLRKIAGFCERLADKYKGQLDEKADIYIDFVTDGVNRMRELIQGLLEYSRVLRSEISYDKLSVDATIDQVKDNLSESIKKSNVKILYQTLPEIHFDKTAFVQILQNLINNAIKYRGNSDPIIEIKADKIQTSWRFAIKDNGIGIEERYFERIFQMFQRLHRKEEIPGTGIGLALCKKLIERHGGKLWLVSETGKGSTFYFTVPMSKTHEELVLA